MWVRPSVENSTLFFVGFPNLGGAFNKEKVLGASPAIVKFSWPIRGEQCGHVTCSCPSYSYLVMYTYKLNLNLETHCFGPDLETN